jgi:hypothetical protein
MERSYFRSIVKEEWEKDPWFTSEEAAPKLGLITAKAVKRYIGKGWLPAERKPSTGAWLWIIRQSAIDAFLADDPRREHKNLSLRISRQHNSYLKHVPVALQTIWVIKCPVCKHKTTIKANPNMAAPELKSQFLELYTNGTCNHGRVCVIQERGIKADNGKR